MRIGRSFETLIRRLDQSDLMGGRARTIDFDPTGKQVQIVDDVSALVMPIQRVAFSCNVASGSVAARMNYAGIESRFRPVRILHIRLSANAFAAVVPMQSVIALSAGATGQFADFWEYGSDITVVPQTVAGSFPIIWDTAASMFQSNPFSFITATVVEKATMPVLQPGQVLAFSTLTVATAITASIIWEEFREVDGASNSP